MLFPICKSKHSIVCVSNFNDFFCIDAMDICIRPFFFSPFCVGIFFRLLKNFRFYFWLSPSY